MRPAALVLAALVVAGAGGAYLLARDEPAESRPGAGPALRACAGAPPEVIRRVQKGFAARRSGDVLAVERLPNQFGTRHSTPWPYTQDVPLLLYGPGYVKKGFSSSRPVTVADIAPTYAELLDFDGLGRRAGTPLADALLPKEQRNGLPRLIMTVVWDGGGDNMLEQWPDAWPTLEMLISKSAFYDNATVGSSPSITPAVHATIGTGDFPAEHGLPDIRMRIEKKMIDAWEGHSPRYLKTQTLADLWDRANDNEPQVGLLARDYWHLGMLGHGSLVRGGDKDVAVLDALGSLRFTSNEDFYTLPDYATTFDGLAEAVEEVDRRDGEMDGKWLGNSIDASDPKVRETPAWPIFQTQKLKDILTTEGFGTDDVADLFFTNYKGTDLAGHTYNVVEPEVRDDLEQQDHELGELIGFLDERIGPNRYVLALTADHGVTPYPEVTGGWSIETTDMTADIDAAFDTDGDDTSLVLSNRGYQIFLDPAEMEDNDVTAEEIAAFVRDYRLSDNVTTTNKVSARFEDRTDERLFLTAMSAAELRSPACNPDDRLE